MPRETTASQQKASVPPADFWKWAWAAVRPLLGWVFTGLGFCFLYLPWGVSPRTLNYGHYLFEAIPYACLSLGMLLDRWWPTGLPKVYLVIVIGLFLLFLPFYTAIPVPTALWQSRLLHGPGLWTWFPSWV